jgi:predicted phosphodiesterase
MCIFFLLASIYFISDVQIDSNSSYPESIATRISEQIGAQVVYDCGDLAENAYQCEYDVYKTLFPNAVPVPGNHDWYNNLACYCWDQTIDVYQDGVHIVGVDTSLRLDQTTMSWLQATLDDGDDVFTIFMTHYPLYSANSRNGRVAPVVRESFLPLLNAANVDIAISGHGHAYEHHVADGRHYFVIGGGGAPLDELDTSATLVAGASVHHWLELDFAAGNGCFTVRGLDGSIIDTCNITQAVANHSTSWGAVKRLFR